MDADVVVAGPIPPKPDEVVLATFWPNILPLPATDVALVVLKPNPARPPLVVEAAVAPNFKPPPKPVLVVDGWVATIKQVTITK